MWKLTGPTKPVFAQWLLIHGGATLLSEKKKILEKLILKKGPTIVFKTHLF